MRISKGVIKTVDVEFLGCVGLSRICTGSTGAQNIFRHRFGRDAEGLGESQ